ALDWLRDTVAPFYEQAAAAFFENVWRARNEYIGVIVERSAENLDRFFAANSTRELSHGERVTALELLELQRHAMLMYTSCGWFFDEISGIETVQVLQYAGRVIQLAEQTSREHLEPEFLSILARAHSNIPEYGNGAEVYERFVKPAVIDLRKVAAHFAISAMFDGHHETPKFCYDIATRDFRRLESGIARLGVGRARVSSKITRESRELTF